MPGPGLEAPADPVLDAVSTDEQKVRAPLVPRHAWLAAGVAVAVATAVLVRHGLTANGIILAPVCGCLVWLSALDLSYRLLPNRIVLPAAAAAFAARVVTDPGHTLEWFLAAIGAALFLLVPALIRPDALGLGDVKLALLLGAAFGYAVVAVLFLGLVASALVALGLLATRGRAGLKTTMPLGPFLAAGAIAVALIA